MGLQGLIERVVRKGALTVVLPGGRRIVAGDGSGPAVEVRVLSNVWAARIAANAEVAVGDAYMEGGFVLESGDIYDLIEIGARNRQSARPPGPIRRWAHDHLFTRNERRQARNNVERHYETPLETYRRFLDPDLQYSCAYFVRPGQSLEEAQRAKQRHIAAKLLLSSDSRVLDIGCGWGGLALRLAADTGARVDGVTLSPSQLQVARERGEAAGLDDRVRFSLTDYRDVEGPYDRIVSVGMFEHVGRPNYEAYFRQVARLLTDDGVAVIHSIGRADGPGVTQPWLAKHIFPGGYIPALSETLAAVERAGLFVTDVEILRLHYAETLRSWRERFRAAWAEIAAEQGERFCRMWEFYLAASEIGFRYTGHMVFQLQLAKKIDAVPLTRAYIEQAERQFGKRLRSVA